MAGETADAITQSTLHTLGNAAPVAMSGLYQALAQALGNTTHNMGAAQQRNNVVAVGAAARNANEINHLSEATGGKNAADITAQKKEVNPPGSSEGAPEKKEPYLCLHSKKPEGNPRRNFDLPDANCAHFQRIDFR